MVGKLPSFVKVRAPTNDELLALLQTVIAKLMKLLTRRGVLMDEMGRTYLIEPDADGGRGAHAAGCSRCLPHRLRAPRWAKDDDSAGRDAAQGYGSTAQHAAVRVEAHDRKLLEQLCRYSTRPALSDERLQRNAAGYRLTAEWLVARSAERPSEYHGLIADHFEKAGDSANAIIYLCKAASDAAQAYLCQRAEVHAAMGRTQEAASCYVQAAAACRKLNRPLAALEMQAGLARLAIVNRRLSAREDSHWPGGRPVRSWMARRTVRDRRSSRLVDVL